MASRFGSYILSLQADATDLVRGIGKGVAATAKLTGAQAALGSASRGSALGLGAAGGAALTAGVAFTAVSAAVRGAISSHMEFEQSLQDVLAVSQATEGEMKALSMRARELGATTKFTATQAGEGMLFLSMAGLTAQESLEAITDSLHLAAAGNLELASAADIVTNVMSGLQLAASDVGKIADVLALAASSANTNVEQLGVALSYVGPVGAKAGLELEDLAAAIGVLSDNGIQAERAGTGLRAVIASLLNPSGKAKRVIDRLGVSIKNMDGTTKDTLQILEELRMAQITASDAVTLFGKRQAAAALVLIDSFPALEGLRERLAGAAGAAQRMAEVRLDTLAGDIIKLKSAYEGLEITVAEGRTALLRGGVQETTAFVRSLESVLKSDPSATLGDAPKIFGAALGRIIGQRAGRALQTSFLGSAVFQAELPDLFGGDLPEQFQSHLDKFATPGISTAALQREQKRSREREVAEAVAAAEAREKAEKKARQELERTVSLRADNASKLNALNRELEQEAYFKDRLEVKGRALAAVTAAIEDLESTRTIQAQSGLKAEAAGTQKLIDLKMELKDAIEATNIGTAGQIVPTIQAPIGATLTQRPDRLLHGADRDFRREVEGIAGARTNAREFARSLDDLATFQDRLNAKQERSRDILREIGDLEEAANLYREFGLEDQAKLLDLQVRRLAYERGIVDELLPKQDEYFTRLEAIGMNLGNALEDVYSQIGGIITQSESWEDVWKRLLRLGAFELFDAFLGRENAPSIFGGRQNRIRPPRHSGGPVTAGNVYPVRPGEMFMSANMDGYIDPNPAQRGGVLIEKGAIQITGYSAEQSEAIAQAAIGQVEQRLAQRQHYSQLHRRNG